MWPLVDCLYDKKKHHFLEITICYFGSFQTPCQFFENGEKILSHWYLRIFMLWNEFFPHRILLCKIFDVLIIFVKRTITIVCYIAI